MIFIASLNELHKMLSWIKKELLPMHFDSSELNKIEVASEEALVNIMNHAYQGRSEEVEIIVICFPKSHAEIHFIDHGPAFNPLDQKEVDLDLPLEEREIGGLGIHFIHKCVDEILYHREGDQNKLKFVIRSSQKQ